jgi:hypothetical protein
MKKAISLSLLLLITGNGLMVTHAHAGFESTVKNISQYGLSTKTQKDLGAACAIVGAVCLFAATITGYPLLEEIMSLNRNMSITANADAANKGPYQGYANAGRIAIKDWRAFILKALAAGIPLTALGTYLLKKG